MPSANLLVTLAVCVFAVGIIILLVYRCMAEQNDPKLDDEGAMLMHELAGSEPLKYTVQKKLGDGTYGTVYLARRNEDQVMVAIKVVPCSTEKQAHEALQEYTTCQSLQGHPNVVKLLDLFQDEPLPSSTAAALYGTTGISTTVLTKLRIAVPKGSTTFVCTVSEYYSRGTLFDLLAKRKKGFEEHMVWEYTRQLLSSLVFMHSNSLIHRDVKPSNILVSADEQRLALTDFGLSRELLHGEYPKTKIGTYHYMAPEQMDHQRYNGKVDVWAVGCMVYGMCTAKVTTRDAVVMFVAKKAPDFETRIKRELTGLGYSDEMASFTLNLLQELPANRPTSEAAFQLLRQITEPARKA